jgi:hypothetical protein
MDSLAVKKLIENYRPTNSMEFYFATVVAGLLLAWVAYLYFKNKGGLERAGQSGNTGTGESLQRLHPEDRTRLEKIEDSVRTLGEAFKGIVHDRGEMMAEVGKISGRLEEISKRTP